ncbi:hypothetical protein OpiT1DRAFT_05058 [Opitutaceae bacterium TAV1]|nr:hypothetical protein OpiT1DRAFT_05058 [Opitutaceae bacterium TAV1]
MRFYRHTTQSIILAVLVVFFVGIPDITAGNEFILAGEERNVVALSSGFQSDENNQNVAADLAVILGKITGKTPRTEHGASHGIVLAVAADFPSLAKEVSLDPDNPLGREDYLMRSSGNRLLLMGATALGTHRAIADLLHRWGYRQFFAGKSWEVVSRTETLSLVVNEVQRPAYHFRDIFTVNYLPGEEDAFKRWRWLNRLGAGFTLNTRHAYGDIYKRNAAEFAENPDYFASVDGKRPDQTSTQHFKFNAASPALLQLLVNDAQNFFTANPTADSVSMEPSDFSGWDNTGEASRIIGGPSNQAVTMANVVAREVAAPLGKYVGMYAYYDHQYPPDIAVEPNIIVSFATRFLKPGRDLYESIRAWQEKGVRIVGIRDYHSVTGWDLALPGRALGGNLHYLGRTIPKFHDHGARFYTTESQSAWGAYGLGYYVTTRLLWNPGEDPEAIVADFLEKSFGPAAGPMARFYSLLNGEDSVMLRHLKPTRLYSPLLEALDASSGREDVQRRITELLAYVRYVELIGKMDRAREEDKPDLLREIYDWVFRIDSMKMLPTKALVLRKRQALRGLYVRYLDLSDRDIAAMQQNAAARPVSREELVALARPVVGRPDAITSSLALPSSPMENKIVSSPWMRNAACFVFPLAADDRVEATLSMRRFGFSEQPRYIIEGPDGRILNRGQLQGDRSQVIIEGASPGYYALIVEYTPNLVRCEAPRGFYLKPPSDTASLDVVRYTGSLYFSLPEGQNSQVIVGGQGDGEKVGVVIFSGDGQIIASAKSVSGNQPLVTDLRGASSPGIHRIRIRKPETGHFEDAFVRFSGSQPDLIALSPDSLPAQPGKTAVATATTTSSTVSR